MCISLLCVLMMMMLLLLAFSLNPIHITQIHMQQSHKYIDANAKRGRTFSDRRRTNTYLTFSFHARISSPSLLPLKLDAAAAAVAITAAIVVVVVAAVIANTAASIDNSISCISFFCVLVGWSVGRWLHSIQHAFFNCYTTDFTQHENVQI